MGDPALWQAEGLTEGEDTATQAVCGDAPSTTGCAGGPPPRFAMEELR